MFGKAVRTQFYMLRKKFKTGKNISTVEIQFWAAKILALKHELCNLKNNPVKFIA